MKVICDSTVIIGLAKIGKLDLLKQIYGEVYIPEAVFIEVVVEGKEKNGAKETAELEWVKRKPVKDKRIVEILFAELGRGEAEVLVLGKELNADLLIIDDERARTAAISANFQVIGLIGVLLLAKHLNFINQIKPFLEELKNKNFRLSDKLIEKVLKLAGEQ
ncbi:MAG: DUF3368 domain-containing protein [Candidatus Poribacteria bacterium]